MPFESVSRPWLAQTDRDKTRRVVFIEGEVVGFLSQQSTGATKVPPALLISNRRRKPNVSFSAEGFSPMASPWILKFP
jgi:hypothetical protein